MRVAIALSGGVDSAVAASRMIKAGHDVTGVHLLMGTASVPETKDAQAVADQLGIELVVWDIRERFDERVLKYFTDSYEQGRTPNPCLRCNREVKFGGLLSRGMEEGFDAVATGHYAHLETAADGTVELHRAANKRKDQSYVLGVLTQDDLQHVLFPLGDVMDKSEVRAEAEKLGLVVAEKPDSTDICFLTDGDAADFIARRIDDKVGEIVDETGQVLGTHQGIHHFTIGQRKGMRLQKPAADGQPRYVTGLDAELNIVRVGQGKDLLVGSLDITQPSNTGIPLEDGWHGLVQYRAHGAAVPATIKLDGEDVHVIPDEPIKAVAPGQFIVFYDGDKVRGSAEIVRTHRLNDVPAQAAIASAE